MIRSGLLDHIVDVYKPSKHTNAFGEVEETMEYAFQIKAKVKHENGEYSISNDEIVYPYRYTFETYLFYKIEEKDELRHGNKRYNILAITEFPLENKQKIDTQLINE